MKAKYKRQNNNDNKKKCKMWNAKYKLQNAEYKVQNVKCEIQNMSLIASIDNNVDIILSYILFLLFLYIYIFFSL